MNSIVFLNNTDNNNQNKDNSDAGVETEDSDNNLIRLTFYNGNNNIYYKITSIQSATIVKVVEYDFLIDNALGTAIDYDKVLLIQLLDNKYS